MASNTKLAVLRTPAVYQWLLMVGWVEEVSPPVGSIFSAQMALSDTNIHCSKARLAIASATTTGPGTTSLAVNFSNFHQVFD